MSQLIFAPQRGYRLPKEPSSRWRGIAVEGPWNDDLDRQYRERNANAIVVRHPANDCSFISTLPNLEGLTLNSKRVTDDSPIFTRRELTHLTIYSGGKNKPLRADLLPNLVDLLCFESRTGLETIAGLSKLRTLRISIPKSVTDLSWLHDLPSLWRLELSGDGQPMNLDGLLDRLPELLWLDLVGFEVADLSWLTPRTKLRQLTVTGGHTRLDLATVERVKSLRDVAFDRVKSLEPVRELQRFLRQLVVHHADELQAEPYPVDPLSILSNGESTELYMPMGAPGDKGAIDAGDDPTGYFWVQLLALVVSQESPQLKGSFVSDSEGDTFVVSCSSRRVAKRLKSMLDPYVLDPGLTCALVLDAKARGSWQH